MVDKKKKQISPDDVTQANISLEGEELLLEEEDFLSEPAAPTENPPMEEDAELQGAAVNMTADVPVRLVAVLGRKTVSFQDLLKLKLGQVVNLERPPNEIVDLVANGKLVARGELVEIDGQLGVKVIKVLK